MRFLSGLLLAAIVSFTACDYVSEEEQFRREEKAAAIEDEIRNEMYWDMIFCAENHARTLYEGGDAYYAVTIDDLEQCP
jgi:hypothetical protein